MSRTPRGQAALEFIMMMALALSVGALFLFVALESITRTAQRERTAALDDVGYMLQDEVVLATTVQDGYSRTITVPQLAGRFTYAVSSAPNAVTLSSGDVTITYPIPNVTGGFAKGTNTLRKRGTVEVVQP